MCKNDCVLKGGGVTVSKLPKNVWGGFKWFLLKENTYKRDSCDEEIIIYVNSLFL